MAKTHPEQLFQADKEGRTVLALALESGHSMVENPQGARYPIWHENRKDNPDSFCIRKLVKLDIRTGIVIAAEKMKKADKLLKLTVDIGLEHRTIVSGIAKHYAPEDLVGQEVVLLVNLAPRKLRGVESQGMILTAENTKGELCLISPKEVFGSGFVVK